MPKKSALIAGASGDVGPLIATTYAEKGYDLKLAGRDVNRRLLHPGYLFSAITPVLDFLLIEESFGAPSL